MELLYKTGWGIYNYACIFVIFFVWYCLGDAIFLKLNPKGKEEIKYERIVFSIALGIGSFYLILLTLGIGRILYPEIAIATLLLLFILCRKSALKSIEIIKSFYKEYKWSLFFSILFLLPFVIIPLYPPKDFDETLYHLPFAKEYIKHHAFIYNSEIRGATQPHLSHMVFAFLMPLGDYVFVHLFEFFTLLLTVVAIMRAGFKHSLVTGLIAGVLLFSNPYLIYVGGTAYVEGGLVFFCTSAFLSFINYHCYRDSKWILLTGIFSGLAAATKYTGFLFVAFFFLWLILFPYKNRWENILIFLFPVFLLTSPWLLRNTLFAGNPFYPFFRKIFVGEGIKVFPLYPPNENISSFRFNIEMSISGIWRAFRDFLVLPYHLFKHEERFVDGLWFFWPNFQPLLYPTFSVLIMSPLFILIKKREIRNMFFIAFSCSFFYLIVWFSMARQERYLFPILPLNAFMSAIVLVEVFETVKFWRFSRTWSLIIFLIVLMLPAWKFASKFVRREKSLPVTTEEIETFFEKHYPQYSAYKFLNSFVKENDDLYVFRDECMRYFFKGNFHGDHFGPYAYKKIIDRLYNPDLIYNFLEDIDAEYFLVGVQALSSQQLESIFYHRRFLIIYGRPNLCIFKVLKNDRIPYNISTNVLRNASFENISDGILENWGYRGELQVENEGCMEGDYCILVPPHKSIFQSVVVPEKSIYIVSYCARSVTGTSSVDLKINWYTSENNKKETIRTDVKRIPLTPQWKCDVIFVTSPFKAEISEFNFYTSGNNTVVLDNLSVKYIRDYEIFLSEHHIPYPQR